jgi:predicted small secreted protein
MKTIMLRFIIPILTGALLVFSGTGCANTAEGVGEDVEEMGDDIKDATN